MHVERLLFFCKLSSLNMNVSFRLQCKMYVLLWFAIKVKKVGVGFKVEMTFPFSKIKDTNL